MSPAELIARARTAVPAGTGRNAITRACPLAGEDSPRRSGGRGVLAGLAAAGVLGTLVWLSVQSASYPLAGLAGRAMRSASTALHMNVSEVLVGGRVHTPSPALLTALGIRRGEPLFAVNLDAAKRRLEALPWIASASVERRLPNRIVVRVVERVPVGRLRRGAKIALVDTMGVVFAPRVAERFTNLLLLSGAGAAQSAPALMALLSTRPELARRVVAARRLGDRRWDLTLRGGLIVRLPEQHAGRAWLRLAALDRRMDLVDRGLVAIDLRLPDRMILRFAPGLVPAATTSGKTT